MLKQFQEHWLLLPPILTTTIWVFVQSDLGFTGQTLTAVSRFASFNAIILLQINLLLSSRLWFLDRFFGFDRIYKWHKLVGISAFSLILLHPFLLIIELLPQGIPWYYIIPGTYIPYTLGIVSLWLLTLLVVLTLYINLPYHIWKKIHKFMGLAVLGISMHSLLIPTPFTGYLIVKIWLYLWIAVGMSSYLYRQLLHRRLGPKHKVQLTRFAQIGDIIQIHVKPLTGPIRFIPGQFAFLSVENHIIGKEEHPFSFSSGPHLNSIRFSIKKAGDYTNQLDTLQKSTKIVLVGPYGKFADRFVKTKKPSVWIAGGIGITPFLSMLSWVYRQDKDRVVSLFYSTKSQNDAYALKEIREKMANMKNAHLYHRSTSKNGRLDAAFITQKVPWLNSADIYLCGPKPMMYGLARQFQKIGISHDHLIFEDFSLK